MKYKTFLVLLLVLVSSVEGGWRQKPRCKSGCGIPAGWCQQGCEPKYCYQPYVKYVYETCKIPECSYIPEEKWVRGTKYVPRTYEQKFIKYVPQVYTQKIVRYEPVDTYSKYYTYNKCVKYNRTGNWVPKTYYRKCKYCPPDCGQYPDCSNDGRSECGQMYSSDCQ